MKLIGRKEKGIIFRKKNKTKTESMAQTLIAAKAEVNTVDSEGVTPLLLAVKKGILGVTQRLLFAKADANHADKSKSSPILIASKKGDVKIVRELIRRNANVNANAKRMSPLMLAAA